MIALTSRESFGYHFSDFKSLAAIAVKIVCLTNFKNIIFDLFLLINCQAPNPGAYRRVLACSIYIIYQIFPLSQQLNFCQKHDNLRNLHSLFSLLFHEHVETM